MAKQSIFGRIAQLLKANVNALIDSAEDPQLMLDQLLRDYDNNIADAESAVATTIGNVRLLEQDYEEDIAAAGDWGRKALAASQKADQLRTAGDIAGADKFDALAKIALGKQITAEGEAKTAKPTIDSQNEIVEKLKAGLMGLKAKREQLVAKRNELVARAKVAEAQSQVLDAIKSVDIMDPSSDLGRFEEKIRREEAKVLGQQELAASSLDAQFESLDDVGEEIEIEARLSALKSGGQAAISS
jgi:phage shock protein A